MHRFARLLVGITFLLLVAGALVTSTGSGLAVPDWPLSFGRFFPPMVGGVLYEHGHRLLAGCVAALTLILCLWILAKEPRAWVRHLALGTFGVVCLQAMLGGITVLFRLPPTVSIAHAGLAEIFFSLVVSIAIVVSPSWNRPSAIKVEAQDALPLRVLSLAAVAAVYLQILLGAVVRHTRVGIAFHLLGAVAVLFFVGRLVYFVNAGYGNEPVLRRPAMASVHLVGVQLFLGIAAWVAKIKSAGAIPPAAGKIWLTTIHLAMGALLFGMGVTLTWRIFRLSVVPAEDAQDKVPA